MRKRTKKTNPLSKIYNYGGEMLPLSEIIKHLQTIAPNQACVDRYLQGMFHTQGTP